MLPAITGAVYLQDCPQQHYIPVYVLVCGVFGVFLALLSCLPCRQGDGGGRSNHAQPYLQCVEFSSFYLLVLLDDLW